MTSDVQVAKNVEQESQANDVARDYVLPRSDIYQNAKDVILRADMPGVDNAGVSVSVENHHLVVEGQPSVSAPANHRLLRQEFRTVPYRRVFRLADDVHEDGIQASIKNGVLTVRIPTSDPAKTKRIPVERA